MVVFFSLGWKEAVANSCVLRSESQTVAAVSERGVCGVTGGGGGGRYRALGFFLFVAQEKVKNKWMNLEQAAHIGKEDTSALALSSLWVQQYRKGFLSGGLPSRKLVSSSSTHRQESRDPDHMKKRQCFFHGGRYEVREGGQGQAGGPVCL